LDFDEMRDAVYPGRGIVIGQTPDGTHLVQIYWIMGRSPSSRNRVFVQEDRFVKTDTVDKTQKIDPLTMYYPIKMIGDCHIVTNGDQTDTIYEAIQGGGSFETALYTRTFEPDAPNYTPRISGLVDLNDPVHAYRLAILKTVASNPDHCVRQFFNFETAVCGTGHCITTYRDDGDPLPSFIGEPFCVEMFDSLDQTVDYYWDVLNEDNKVSMLVKFISPERSEIRIVNKYKT